MCWTNDYSTRALRHQLSACSRGSHTILRDASKTWSGSEASYARLPEGLDQADPVGAGCRPGALCPRGRAGHIEDCGYPSSMDQPQAVTALLLYWLQNG